MSPEAETLSQAIADAFFTGDRRAFFVESVLKIGSVSLSTAEEHEVFTLLGRLLVEDPSLAPALKLLEDYLAARGGAGARRDPYELVPAEFRERVRLADSGGMTDEERRQLAKQMAGALRRDQGSDD